MSYLFTEEKIKELKEKFFKRLGVYNYLNNIKLSLKESKEEENK